MKHLLLLFISVTGLTTVAQTDLKCGSASPTVDAIKKTKQLVSSSSKTDELRIIPVVFHVLHQFGNENITDAQIFDQMNILNADFQRLNADTANVQAPFDTIIGKVNFEFRLAHLDPWGNPTTGIERIATPLTNLGNEDAMINMWDPTKYVNIWVANVTLPGVSGFSTNPLVNQNPCVSGIMMLHDYIGSIGTGSSFTSFALTHEMGHYFGLFHTFGDTCGDSDGIYDTPYTLNNGSCNFTANSCNDSLYADSFDYWGFDPRNNVENFMDYSWCSFMFTNAQAAMVRAVQESPLYGRDQLSTEANLIATGTGPGPQTASATFPYSNFTTESKTICVGESLQLINGTGMTAGDTYEWDFPGGTPSTSTAANPTVSYSTPGFYEITLTVTNTNGSSSFGTIYSIVDAVYVAGNWDDFYGPNVQDFDVNNELWITKNHFYDASKFAWTNQNGVNVTPCYVLNNHLITDSSMLCSPIAYQNNLEGKKDELITPAFGLNYTTNTVVSFDYAYGSAETAISEMTEKLKIFSSRDCGETWIQRKIIADTALTTAFENIGNTFVPTANQWKHASFNYSTTAMDNKTRFKFEFTAANHSNYLYIDNFRIDGVLGIENSELGTIDVFPNPVSKGNILHISNSSENNNFTIQLLDLQGKLLFEKNLIGASEVQLPETISAGMYMVKINNSLQRLVIE